MLDYYYLHVSIVQKRTSFLRCCFGSYGALLMTLGFLTPMLAEQEGIGADLPRAGPIFGNKNSSSSKTHSELATGTSRKFQFARNRLWPTHIRGYNVADKEALHRGRDSTW